MRSPIRDIGHKIELLLVLLYIKKTLKMEHLETLIDSRIVELHRNQVGLPPFQALWSVCNAH